MFAQTFNRIGQGVRLPLWLRRSHPTFSRRHARRECALRATMRLAEIGADIHGAIVELSCGGCSFRPASMFLLMRDGEDIEIRTDYFAVRARIRATRPEAYGVQFLEELDAALVELVAGQNRGPVSVLAKP